jgi:hypothetical protein
MSLFGQTRHWRPGRETNDVIDLRFLDAVPREGNYIINHISPIAHTYLNIGYLSKRPTCNDFVLQYTRLVIVLSVPLT